MPSFAQGEIKKRQESNKPEEESQKVAVIIKYLDRRVIHKHLRSLSTRIHQNSRPLPRTKHKKKEKKTKSQNATKTNSESQHIIQTEQVTW
jgi:hypothetical protein